jgi:creatinine amidohydrolase
MTWKQVEAIDKSKAVVLLPIGVLEQHGPGGPMGIDYILAEHLSVEAAKRLDDVYVAPTIAYGHSPSFMGFAGTISIRIQTLQALIEDVIDGLFAHGFRYIIMVDNHGGNEVACEQAALAVRKRHGITLANLYPWRLANHVSPDLYRDPRRAFGHGAEPTISVAMALLGDDVDRDALVAGRNVPLPGFESSGSTKSRFKGFDVGLYVDTREVNSTGAAGDPAEASKEKGQEILRRMIDYFVEFIPTYRSLVTGRLAKGAH